MNTESKDTPRTDAVTQATDSGYAHVPADFARTLEQQLTDAQARVAELQQAVVAASAAERGWRLQAEDARRYAKQCRGYIADIADEVTPEDEDVPTTDGLYEYIVERIKALRTELGEVKKFWLAEKESAGKVYVERDQLRGEVTNLRSRYAPNEVDACIEQLQQRVAAKESELSALESQLREARAHSNGLFMAIHDRLKPFFAPDSRHLEWDVLPSTVLGIAHRAEAAEAKVAELEKALATEAFESNVVLVSKEQELTAERQKVAELERCYSFCDAGRTKERQHRERLEAALVRTQDLFALIEREFPAARHFTRFIVAKREVAEALAQSQPAPAIASSAQASSSGAEPAAEPCDKRGEGSICKHCGRNLVVNAPVLICHDCALPDAPSADCAPAPAPSQTQEGSR